MDEKDIRASIIKDIEKLESRPELDRRDLTMLLQAKRIVELGWEGYLNLNKEIQEYQAEQVAKRLRGE